MTSTPFFEVPLSLPYDQAITAVKEAFKAEGFGVLTHVDVTATLKEKLNETFRPYSIFGVCNPGFAHRLLTADPRIGLVLPCKVTVEVAEGGGSLVRVINPETMVASGLSDAPEVTAVAQEVAAIVRRVVQALESRAG